MMTTTWDAQYPNLLQVELTAPFASWDAYHAAMHTLTELIASRTDDVHVLFVQESAHMPAGDVVAHLRAALGALPPNTGALIMVITDPLMRSMADFATRLMGSQRFTFTRSVQQAYAYLEVEMMMSGRLTLEMPKLG